MRDAKLDKVQYCIENISRPRVENVHGTLLVFSCPGNHVMFCYCMENISQSGVKIVHGTLLIVHFVVTRFLKTI